MLAIATAHNEQRLVIVLMQLCIIIAAARLAGGVFRRLGQPTVVGEIAAGLLLGPSVFGKLQWLVFHDHRLSDALFDPSVTDIFQVLSQLGLILLLFLIGLEFDFTHLRRGPKAALSISVAGVALPFGLGWLLARAIAHKVGAIDVHGFSLFMGTAMSITALPILGRMMIEFNITRTRLAAVTISAAALDDATGWILLAAVSALVQARFNVGATLTMIAATLVFACVMIFVVRPVLVRWIAGTMRRNQGNLSLTALATLLVIVFVCAIVTSKIGIFAIFGAFLLGAILSDQPQFRTAVVRQLQNFVTAFFLPIFFTYTGLRTDIDTLAPPALWGIAVLVSAAAITGKLGGCTLAARLGGMTWRESACVGTMMNTRALMELIVINVGLSLGIIPPSVFCMLVIMAVLTTFMTTPLLRRLKRGTELDAPMAATRFGR